MDTAAEHYVLYAVSATDMRQFSSATWLNSAICRNHHPILWSDDRYPYIVASAAQVVINNVRNIQLHIFADFKNRLERVYGVLADAVIEKEFQS